MTSKLKFLFGSYIVVSVALFLYSFTQVDLSLTLSEASWWQIVQKFFQQIGYFNRPLSTLLYLILIFLFFIFYSLFIKLAQKNQINTEKLWVLILMVTGILTFSYNAFSYDLFNYIFDAKIITFYNQTPYAHKALDYVGDPMLTFMRWTHRIYPYGPIWLFLTAPLSYLGFNLFLPTFFLFKIFNSLYFLGTAFFIQKILQKTKRNESLGLILFALNPLVIIESLISSHNDTAMMFFAILSIYLLFQHKKTLSIVSLLLSVGVKFATIFLLPSYLYYFFRNKFKNFTNEKFIELNFILMFLALIAVILRTNFQPWYLLYIIPLASLLPGKNYAVAGSIILPFFALLEYIPYLYKGDWNDPIPQVLMGITMFGAFTYIVYIALSFRYDKLSLQGGK